MSAKPAPSEPVRSHHAGGRTAARPVTRSTWWSRAGPRPAARRARRGPRLGLAGEEAEADEPEQHAGSDQGEERRERVGVGGADGAAGGQRGGGPERVADHVPLPEKAAPQRRRDEVRDPARPRDADEGGRGLLHGEHGGDGLARRQPHDGRDRGRPQQDVGQPGRQHDSTGAARRRARFGRPRRRAPAGTSSGARPAGERHVLDFGHAVERARAEGPPRLARLPALGPPQTPPSCVLRSHPSPYRFRFRHSVALSMPSTRAADS